MKTALNEEFVPALRERRELGTLESEKNIKRVGEKIDKRAGKMGCGGAVQGKAVTQTTTRGKIHEHFSGSVSGIVCLRACLPVYSAYIAAKALTLDDRRVTPAHAYEDGHNYVPSPKWVLFGHHFAAIAGEGPLVGPTLAAQFGFAPGFLWILIGAVLAGCVQDFMVLVASIRHKGRSLADVARTEVSPFTGLVAMFAVLLILLLTLAGLGVVVVNALANSPWGVFTIGMTIPIAIFMGLYMFKSTPGKIKVAVPSAASVVLLLLAV